MSQFVFVKSSYSSSGGECVEVARNIPGVVALRDSKATGGPVVRVGPSAWAAFVSSVPCRSGRR
ncbi:DUF397 domain-containing protein [Streptomyces sp. NRRL S-87]|uniref:DUF397 domain-containing protein n=1 Tax=Streptomyces sp. NRRL S-87 TaxID=1463920 RepID=UPI00099D18BC|nr:DUF397 domain-containing protein [Streptomyces sp. NRRL S-87]